MGSTSWSPPRFGDALPDMAEEVARDLRHAGHEDLARQVPDLPMLSLCACGDPFCASFHTGYKDPKRPYDHTAVGGPAIVDVLDGKIVYVEIITEDHSELRDQVRAVFGKPPEAGKGGGI